MMRFSQLEAFLVRHRLLFLLLTAAFLYLAFIGLREVWYPDEPDIAEVARAMYRSGDWVSPRRMGVIWVDYPPMVYWIGTISSHLLGGMSAFSLRLPNALAAIVTILLTARVAGRWFGERAGLWAGFSLLTFMAFVYEGNSYRPDVSFTLAITVGMLSYAAGSGHAGGSTNLYAKVLAFFFFGVAMLAKGPLGLLLPGLVLVVWLGLRRDWLQILQLAPLAVVSLLVYGAWFVTNGRAMGMENMLYEFYAQNFERFLTSENRGHGQPWYYYLRNFWLDFSPWSWLFPPALLWLYRTRRYRDARIQLALLWFFIFIAFLSVAATKRQLYLLPAFPAVALLLGSWLSEVSTRRSESAGEPVGTVAVPVYATALSAVFVALGGFLVWAAPNLQSLTAGRDMNSQELEVVAHEGVPLLVLGITLLASAVLVATAWRTRGNRAALLGIGVSHVAIYAVILALVMPGFEPVKSYKPQSEWISAQIGAQTRFGMVDPHGIPRRGGFAYYTQTDVDLLTGFDAAAEYLHKYPDTIILIRDSEFERDFRGRLAEAKLRLLTEIRVGSHLYLAVGPDRT